MIAAAVLALGIVSVGEPDAWDRERLIAALTALTRTGEPRHIDHDAGQQLWMALEPKLRNERDRELRWLATRAAVPIVIATIRPITPVGEAPVLEVRAERVLPLPWRTSLIAAIDAQVDAREWRNMWTIRDGNRAYVQLENVLTRDELAAGFHVLHLRARIHYDSAPSGMPRDETRELPDLAYGLWNPAARIGPGADVAAFVGRGRSVALNILDAGMPELPLATWLERLGGDVWWHTDWCAHHAHPSDEFGISNALCVVGRSTEPAVEVWVRIGMLDHTSNGARWIETAPSVEAAYLPGSCCGAPVPAPILESLTRTAEWARPKPQLIAPRDEIRTIPAIPKRGQPTLVQASVVNVGSAAAYGVRIDVLAASGLSDEPFHQVTVRDIGPGDRVDLSYEILFPAEYGWVEVWAMILSDHSAASTEAVEPADTMAIALLNREGMPPSFAEFACRNAVGAGQCR